jgi:hypothetical protein
MMAWHGMVCLVRVDKPKKRKKPREYNYLYPEREKKYTNRLRENGQCGCFFIVTKTTFHSAVVVVVVVVIFCCADVERKSINI